MGKINFNLSLIIILWVMAVAAHGQTVTTLIESFPGDGEFSFDNLGNLYVNDSGENGVLNGHRVYKVNPQGEFSLFSENLPIWVVGSSFDHHENLLVTGWSAGTISSITADGNATIIANNINGAGSLEVDEEGHIYVAEYLAHRVLRFDDDGQNRMVYAMGFPIRNPAGLAYVASKRDLYVSNWTDGNICRIDSTGQITIFATLPHPSVGPIKIYEEYLYATSPQFHKIFKINLNNPEEVILFAGTGVAGNQDGNIDIATFNTPTGIGTWDGNTFYVTETYQGTGRLRQIDNESVDTYAQTAEDKKNDIVISPNPTSQTITINTSFETPTDFECSIVNQFGQIIPTALLIQQTTKQYQFNINQLPSGNYTLIFQWNNGREKRTQSLIKY